MVEGEAVSFLFENLNSVTQHDTLPHRLKRFSAEQQERET